MKMLLRILKKDLKRKKTMNIILLLFVIMCSMFAAASVNNIFAVTGGIDSYFNKAGVPDLMLSLPYGSELGKEIASLPSVTDVKEEHHLTVLDSGCFMLNGRKFDNFTNVAHMINSSERAIIYFDENNDELAEPEKGEFYATSVFSNDSDLKPGDTVALKTGSTELLLKYKGRFKPAVYGQSSTDYPYLMLNEEDFKACEKDPVFLHWAENLLFIETSDPEGVAAEYDGIPDVWYDTRDERKDIYFYDMVAAYLMMIISIVLMLTGFVMLRFTIGFTISEEFREIGVMKAIGINSGSIRRIYIVKYLAIAIIGSVIGFFCSLPLSAVMLKNISENMVFDSSNSIVMGLISSAAIILLIMLFCYFCTRKVRKLSPIDAVRSGQTGERFGKKSIMHLGRSRLPSTGFLAANDVLSARKQFIIISLIFALCILLMTIISNSAETLKSNSITGLFGVPDSDITIGDISSLEDVFSGKGMKATVERYNKFFAENNIPASSSISIGGEYETFCGSKKSRLLYIISQGVSDDEFTVDEGSIATRPDEVTLTRKAMELTGAGIGDRIKVNIGGKERELIVTGSFSTFVGGGSAARLCSEYEHDVDKINNSFGVQVKLTGSRDKEAVEKYVRELKKLMNTEKVYSNGEMVETVTGISSTMTSIKRLMMILTVIVTALIVVLMERSFISKEKSEIALMKAIGISSGSIIMQHVLRFVITAALAAAAASAAVLPLSSLVLNWMFSMIGDIRGVSPDFNAAEIFVFCPLILITVALVSSALTALYMKKITASDTASIE